jgi:hypothetical protein
MTGTARRVLTAAALAIAAGCAGDSGRPLPGDAPPRARYDGVTVSFIDAALARVQVSMRGARSTADADAYARCGAAGYAAAKGFGFVRHVRTEVTEEGGIWRADAVYTISSALPRGIRTIDAEVMAADCAERGIPTA